MAICNEPSRKKMKFDPRNNVSDTGAALTGSAPSEWLSLQRERRLLPIFPARQRLLEEIRKHRSVIVIGETGSGKTTQLPQYILEARLHGKRMIAVTQPRRVAAITVAQRVAQERNTAIGDIVGYSVRFEDMTSDKTRIKYMTDGMLLREAILDPRLTRYAVVVLDEAHERTIHTDVLFGVVKSAQHLRSTTDLSPLNIIVMSATMDADHFSRYFNSALVLYVQGRQHNVQVMYTKDTQSDYLFASIVTVFQIHRTKPPDEDILVFLSGQDEIDSAIKTIRDIALDLPSSLPLLLPLPLYAALPSHQQRNVFVAAPQGTRKVIVSTNIAETSVTIPKVKYVIDSGKVKAKLHSPQSGVDLLRVVRVSKAQASQRSGRAGREGPGVCYRLYTELEYDSLDDNTVPEILRCNLGSVVLQLLAMGVRDVAGFDFMDAPPPDAISDAISQLRWLGAVDATHTSQLTATGKHMAAFPVDPRLSRVILSASQHRCLEEVLTIVSMLAGESVLYTPLNKRDEAVAVRAKFASSLGDHMTLLNIYRAFKGVSQSKRWCRENYINQKNLLSAVDIRRQLKDICTQQGLPMESCGQDNSIIRKCFTHGFFMNAAEIQKDGHYISLTSRKPAQIHPSSCLHRCNPEYVIYNELTHTNKTYMRDVCVVDAEWLYETAPSYFTHKVPRQS